MTRKRRAEESWKAEKQQKPNPCSERPSSVGEGDRIQAESSSSSSDEESCDEDIDMSERPASSDPQRCSQETLIPPQDSSNGGWFRIPSLAERMADAPPLASLYEGITEEGLLNDIPEVQPYTWTLEGGYLDAGYNPLNLPRDISGQLDLNKIDVHCDSGDRPLALGSHNDEQGLLFEQHTYSLPESAVGEDTSTVYYPDVPLESRLLDDESDSASPERITLTLHNPSTDTIISLITVAVSSNSPFRFKRD
jgi:hypothetical protein